jgi:HEAT repeat protein
MKRLLIGMLSTLALGCVAGVAAYILVPQLFHSAAHEPGPGGAAAAGAVQVPPGPAPLEAEIKQLVDDFQARTNKQPSDATRRILAQLASRGPEGKATAPLVEAWLRSMCDAGRADSTEFRELAQTLLTADPEAPQTTLAAYRQAKARDDREFCAWKLTAFGKVSVDVVMDGLRQECQEQAQAGCETWSKLPWVLARLGADAFAPLQGALKADSPVLRRQAVRALALMGREQAGGSAPRLALLLADKDQRLRYLAALALGELQPVDKAPPPGLLHALQDPDPVVRLGAAWAVSRCAPASAHVLVPVLVGLLKDNAFARSTWDIDSRRHQGAFDWRLQPCPYYQVYWEEIVADLLIELGPAGQLEPEVIVDLLKRCDHDGRHLTHLLLVQGEKAKAAVPELAALLKHSEPRQRCKALLALGRLGLPLAADTLPAMTAALDDAEPRVRWRAFLTLAQLDAEGTRQHLPAGLAPAVEAARLRPNEPHLAQGRIKTRCLWHDFPTTLQPVWEVPAAVRDPQAVWTLSDEEVAVEETRARAVLTSLQGEAKSTGEWAPFLVAAWYGTADYPRLSGPVPTPVTLTLLSGLGPDAAPAVPALVRGLGWYDIKEIVEVLVKIGEPALPALVQVLEDRAAADRHVAVLQVLRGFGPSARQAIPALVQALRHDQEAASKQAVEALGALGGAGADAVPLLVKLLAEKDNELRRHAVDALGLLGPVAKAALPELLGLFKDDSAQLRVAAARAAGSVGREAVEPLTRALADPDDKMRLGAMLALRQVPGDAFGEREPVLAALKRLADDPQQPAGVREEAAGLSRHLGLSRSELRRSRT